jgi:tetratricopeptide (TPR) repeat protein
LQGGERQWVYSTLSLGEGGIYKKETGEEFKIEKKGIELEAWEWGNKGYSFADLGKHKEALSCYDKALRINPKLAEAHYNKGLSFALLGKQKEAIDALSNFIRLALPQLAEQVEIAENLVGRHDLARRGKSWH